VRGILVVGPYSGGDSRDYHQQVWYREFLPLHGFAFLGAKDFYLRCTTSHSTSPSPTRWSLKSAGTKGSGSAAAASGSWGRGGSSTAGRATKRSASTAAPSR